MVYISVVRGKSTLAGLSCYSGGVMSQVVIAETEYTHSGREGSSTPTLGRNVVPRVLFTRLDAVSTGFRYDRKAEQKVGSDVVLELRLQSGGLPSVLKRHKQRHITPHALDLDVNLHDELNLATDGAAVLLWDTIVVAYTTTIFARSSFAW